MPKIKVAALSLLAVGGLITGFSSPGHAIEEAKDQKPQSWYFDQDGGFWVGAVTGMCWDSPCAGSNGNYCCKVYAK